MLFLVTLSYSVGRFYKISMDWFILIQLYI